MLTLILDAAGKEVTVVLAQDDRVVSTRGGMGRPLAIMHKAIEEILVEQRLSLSEIDHVAVVQGPGSWTGLHVAMDTARTIGLVSKKPLVPISRLDAVAESVAWHVGGVVVLLQASRDQYFVAQYDSRDGGLAQLGSACKGDLAAAALAISDAPRPVLLVGDISDDSVASLEEATGQTYLVESMYGPIPAALARLAFSRKAEAIVGSKIMDLEPIYMQNAEDMPRLYAREA